MNVPKLNTAVLKLPPSIQPKWVSKVPWCAGRDCPSFTCGGCNVLKGFVGDHCVPGIEAMADAVLGLVEA